MRKEEGLRYLGNTNRWRVGKKIVSGYIIRRWSVIKRERERKMREVQYAGVWWSEREGSGIMKVKWEKL